MIRPTRRLPGRAALAAALALTIAACGEPSGPENDLDVTLELPPGATTETSTDGAAPTVICTVPIRVLAEGAGRAFWVNSTLRWFAGPSRTEPFDSVTFSAAEMEMAFGFVDMTSDQLREVQLRVGFGLPFEWEWELRYTVGSRDKSVKLRMPCGPLPPTGAGTPPSVPVLAVFGRDLLRPGDTISVMTSANSAYGLWHTRLVLSGPVDREFLWAERGSQESMHSAFVIVPPDAARDAALVATVMVVDALGVPATRETITSKIVTDVELPVLTSARFIDWNGYTGGDGIPQFGWGDTLAVRLRASDDLGLGHLVYEVEGPGVTFRDSIPFTAIPDSTAFIPIDARWAGANRVSVHLRDLVQKRSVNTVSTPTDSLRFFPTVSRQASFLDIGQHWSSGAYDGPRQRFYFPRVDGRIEVVDAASMTRLPSILMPTMPAGLDVSASGDSVFVALPDTGIAIIDLRGPTPVTTIIAGIANVPAGGPIEKVFPSEIRRDAAGRWVVWAQPSTSGETLLLYFDPVARTFTNIPRDAGPNQNVYVAQLFLTPSRDRGSMVLVETNCVRLYRSSTARFGPCRPMLQWINGAPAPMFSSAGDVITIGQGLYDASLGIAAQQGLARPTPGTNIAHSADGTTRWIVENNHLDRVRVSDGRRLARTFLPDRASRIWLSDDDSFLFIELRLTTTLIRMDLR